MPRSNLLDRLTWDDAEHIRALYHTGEFTFYALAKMTGLCWKTVRRICTDEHYLDPEYDAPSGELAD